MNENSNACMSNATTLDEQSASFSVASKGGMDKRRNWTFILNQNGSWAWQVTKPDGKRQASKQPFKTLSDCTADAVKHGYVVWEGEERRGTERAWRPVQSAR